MIATSTALLAAGLAGAGGSVASGIIGSRAAGNAARTQAEAAERTGAEQTALAREMFNRQQENMKPWLDVGKESLYQLRDLMRPGGDLTKTFDQPFTPPAAFDPKSVQFDPGFERRMEQSQKAIQRWASAGGKLGSGGTAMKLIREAQDMTSDEYGRAHDRTYGRYSDDYGRALTEWNTARNQFMQNQDTMYNRFANLAGTGQTAANQIGSADAAATGALLNATGSREAAAAARAAGMVGSANAWSGGLSGAFNNIQGALTTRALLQPTSIPGYSAMRRWAEAPRFSMSENSFAY